MPGSLNDTPIRNVELFRKVRERVLGENWNQKRWGIKSAECGTSHCAGGWACHENGDTFAWYEAAIHWRNPGLTDVEEAFRVKVEGIEIDVAYRAQFLLGLTTDEADELFDPGNDRETVVELIDQYIEEGKLRCSQRS